MPLSVVPFRSPAVAGDPQRRIGVIDIGSNSIRLVVFAGSARAPLPIFNEKVLCAMGRRLHSTGRLDPEGAELALANLPRFAHAAEALGVKRLKVVGTSALRDAADSAEFVERVRQTARLNIEIISGETEARLSALGLVSALPEADGAIGDLGGGSLELVRLDRGRLGEQATLPLGSLRLTEVERSGALIGPIIKEALGSLPWLPRCDGRTFYAIGGSWRALARIYMASVEYRLRVIDNYRVDAERFRGFAQLIAKQSDASLAGMKGVPARRVDTLRGAARLLRHVLKFTRARFLAFSAQGLREGIIYEELNAAERAEDPLLAAAADLGQRFGRYARLSGALANWTKPVFVGESAARSRLREAACLVSDIGWVDHPDYRARLTYERVLTLPLPSLSHADRAYLANAVYARYEEEPDGKRERAAAELGLERNDWQEARALGQAIRLGYTVGAGHDGHLNTTALSLQAGALVLTVPRLDGAFAGESVRKRLEELAATLGLKPKVAAAGAP